jgi:hypothetical protein
MTFLTNGAILRAVLLMLVLLSAAACVPEIGSEAWCERMQEQARGDWTVNEAADYARHCVFD